MFLEVSAAGVGLNKSLDSFCSATGEDRIQKRRVISPWRDAKGGILLDSVSWLLNSLGISISCRNSETPN